jgi:uncharacterized protein YaeQ
MGPSPTRLDYRVTLSHLDRGLDRAESLIAAQHPSETIERVTLRVLAWCFLNEERLSFGPGLSTRGTPDLWARDLTGRLTTWIECGSASMEEIRRAIQQNPGLSAHAVFSSQTRHDVALREIAEWNRLPRNGTLAIWSLDREAVTRLAAHTAKRQQWSVTVIGSHIYVEVGGTTYDTPITGGKIGG